MTTYLTKQQDGKTFHFRVTATDTGVNIVEGQFYKSITKIYNVTGPDNLKADQKKLVEEKLADGYKVIDFVETKENNFDVYDKAKYHYGGDFPEELDEFQGFVHTGMYVGWLIDNDLIDHEFFSDSQQAIKGFKNRQLTGSQFYEMQMDGVLLIDQVSEIGNRFSFDYFDFDSGQYLNDYETTLARELPTLFDVQDTWENYEKIKKVIDKRFLDWNKKNVEKAWWKVW
jgi:hypothetical protein